MYQRDEAYRLFCTEHNTSQVVTTFCIQDTYLSFLDILSLLLLGRLCIRHCEMGHNHLWKIMPSGRFNWLCCPCWMDVLRGVDQCLIHMQYPFDSWFLSQTWMKDMSLTAVTGFLVCRVDCAAFFLTFTKSGKTF